MRVKNLFEMSYLHNEELGYKVLAKISKDALTRFYRLFSKAGDVLIYRSLVSGFVAGFLDEDGLNVVVSISSRSFAYPTVPTRLGKYVQVLFVNVSKEFAERGHTKGVYNQIAKRIALVSDHEQYLGAQGLWQSLARDSDVNIYVFDGTKEDYVRDSTGNAVKYNGQNIEESKSWGTTGSHRLFLLVATVNNL